jgi:putative NADPH-quinone reductase
MMGAAAAAALIVVKVDGGRRIEGARLRRGERPMGKKIVVINGHPDSRPERFCAALAGAYVAGAVAAGHTVRRIDVGALAPAPIRSMQDFADEPPPAIRQVQENIAWAEHLVLLYPLWLGGPPAVLKAFFEQVFRYGFALGGEGRSMRGLLKGKSARVIVTMGMPASIFRVVFDAPGLKSITRGILLLCGFWPVRSLLIGMVEESAPRRARYLTRVKRLGRAAA